METSSDVVLSITILCHTSELLLPKLIRREIDVEGLVTNTGGIFE